MKTLRPPKRCLVALAVAGLGIANATAQEARPIAAPASERADSDAARLEALRDEYAAAQRAQRDAMRKAKTDAERATAMRLRPWDDVRARFEALAYAASDPEVQAGAWSTIFVNEASGGSPQRANEAFQILVHDHPSSGELVPVVAAARYSVLEREDALAGLRAARELSERRDVRAGATFSLAQLLGEEEDTRDEATALYRVIVAEYADVEGPRGATYGKQASACLYETEHLQVGMQVPDFESVDETGAAFRLADYRGKVVLLDFWGFW